MTTQVIKYRSICLLCDVIGGSRISNSCNRNFVLTLILYPPTTVQSRQAIEIHCRNGKLHCMYTTTCQYSQGSSLIREGIAERPLSSRPIEVHYISLATCISVLLSISYQGNQLPSSPRPYSPLYQFEDWKTRQSGKEITWTSASLDPSRV